MSRYPYRALIGTFLVHVMMADASFADPVYFMGLGDLPGGTFDSRPYGISANGSTVVGSGRSGNGERAFRWTLASGMTSLGTLPGTSNSIAYGISDDGNIIVGQTTPQASAFRWTIETGMLAIDSNAATAQAISGNGQVIVGRTTSGLQSYRWTSAQGMSILPNPQAPHLFCMPWATTAVGTRIVGECINDITSVEYSVHWDFGAVSYFAETYSRTTDVSADGSISVGANFTNGLHAFRWTSQSGMVNLPLPPTFATSGASAISSDGSTIVGSLDYLLPSPRAFIWTSSTGTRSLRDVLISDYGLDLSGWTLSDATAVSADGSTITGVGINPSGNTEAWIAHIPEPTTLSLLAFGSVALLARRRSGR